jgi:hypothetical protein
MNLFYQFLFLGLCLLGFAACGQADTPPNTMPEPDAVALSWQTTQDTSDRVASTEGLDGPEAVRYDPEQDVYFVSNFTGDPNERDANGFISRIGPDGTLEELQFMTGTEAHPLHGPRGMYIVGDTLWVADTDGVHGFHRVTGEQLAFVDFTALEPGFLNDVARGPDGVLYVTDSRASRLYRIEGGTPMIAVDDTLLGPPNGITLDAANGRMLLAPWNGVQTFRSWTPGVDELEEFATSTGGNFDGIEVVGDRIVVASQMDSSLHVIEDGVGRMIIEMPGRPADIGIDTRRMRVAVPYVALDRVDIWELPKE